MAAPSRPRKRPGGTRGKTLRGRYDRSKSSEERQAEQKTKLLDAARDVLGSKGWSGATVDAVLKECQLSRATFYVHYKELDELLIEAYQRATSNGLRIIHEHIQSAELGAERVRAGVTAYLMLVRDNPKIARILLDIGPGAPAAVQTLRAASIERSTALIMTRVAEAHAAGIIPNAPDELTIYALQGALETVAKRYLERGEPEKAMEAGPSMMRMFIRAIT